MSMLFCQYELQPCIILSNNTREVNKNILLWLMVGAVGLEPTTKRL